MSEGDEEDYRIWTGVIHRSSVRLIAQRGPGLSLEEFMSPNQPKTPMRSLRVDEELWDWYRTTAEAEGVSLSEIVRRALIAYKEQHGTGEVR